MPAKYFTVLTNIGSALHANAQIQQTKVPWTHMALGDGGGVEVQPDQKQTGLVREVHRLPITAIDPHPTNPNWIVVEAVVPNNVGGWTVRETAIFGGASGAQCIAVGNYPASYKPVLADGAVREMVMRMIVEISSSVTVNLVIDPAVAIASRQFVEGLVEVELTKVGQDRRLVTWRNAGVFEFQVPSILKSGKKRARICVRGAGGAGGSPASGWVVLVGGGAGQGGFAIKVIDLTGVNTVTVTVGAGGTPVVGTEGSVGGTSSFGSYCSATGGKVFKWDGADGGAGVGGDLNLNGAAGFPPTRHANNDWVIQGRGGCNKQGSVGNVATVQDGAAGQDNGAGGNGGTAAGARGGAGAPGWVSIEW